MNVYRILKDLYMATEAWTDILTWNALDLLLLSFKIIREEMRKGLTQETELKLKNLPLFSASKFGNASLTFRGH